MTSQTRRTLEAVAVTIGLMLCVSVSYAQGPPLTFPQSQQTFFPAEPYGSPISSIVPNGPRPMYSPLYVACRAEVPLHNTEYFTATFPSPTVYSARKEFRELVTAQYGAVSRVQCASKHSEAMVKDIVQEWKDKAHATHNTVVETDWAASAATADPSTLSRSSCYSSPFAQSSCSARIPESAEH